MNKGRVFYFAFPAPSSLSLCLSCTSLPDVMIRALAFNQNIPRFSSHPATISFKVFHVCREKLFYIIK
jgi:hypothetical protein